MYLFLNINYLIIIKDWNKTKTLTCFAQKYFVEQNMLVSIEAFKREGNNTCDLTELLYIIL